MSSKRGEYNSLTFAETIKVIDAVKNSGTKKKKDIADEFGIPTSTLSTKFSQEEKLRQQFTTGKIDFMWKREADLPDVEECLVKWFKQCLEKNVGLGGPILKEKAEVFAKQLGYNDFRVSNGWLKKFKYEKCHGGKLSKDRVTLLLAANMSGTEKCKPLMIGKSKKPWCFARIKSFP